MSCGFTFFTVFMFSDRVPCGTVRHRGLHRDRYGTVLHGGEPGVRQGRRGGTEDQVGVWRYHCCLRNRSQSCAPVVDCRRNTHHRRCVFRSRVLKIEETWGSRGATPYLITVFTTFIVITIITVFPFFLFRTTKTNGIVHCVCFPFVP